YSSEEIKTTQIESSEDVFRDKKTFYGFRVGGFYKSALSSADAGILFLRLGWLNFLCRDGSHRHRQRHHRTADPQVVALALFLK
ncbi:MAG: hypothetical protein QF562_07080, partial [Verrucomicrobiota bacterium]|nr:hypothetical protein [Verrucomicrobiota bacterium]